ncbi:hypothetical protein ACIPLR_15855 [Herbaspirillum huttiense]|jgi:hypothetical protein|uniref:hypothetical protein n=1 Tax=Herbaspirillum TaxID=963 RepID=UPI001AEA32BA|nr:hypothetical protein [Herbaspirillum sp. 1130]MBP1314289.1 hypothetical protein [Herbaspirillum sp. 1130]
MTAVSHEIKPIYGLPLKAEAIAPRNLVPARVTIMLHNDGLFATSSLNADQARELAAALMSMALAVDKMNKWRVSSLVEVSQ